jgi:hypothetical protein
VNSSAIANTTKPKGVSKSPPKTTKAAVKETRSAKAKAPLNVKAIATTSSAAPVQPSASAVAAKTAPSGIPIVSSAPSTSSAAFPLIPGPRAPIAAGGYMQPPVITASSANANGTPELTSLSKMQPVPFHGNGAMAYPPTSGLPMHASPYGYPYPPTDFMPPPVVTSMYRGDVRVPMTSFGYAPHQAYVADVAHLSLPPNHFAMRQNANEPESFSHVLGQSLNPDAL